MTHAPGNGIEDLYRGVIAEVIAQSKEAFLDENIDVEILLQIQKVWEDKINASGAVDLNQKVTPIPASRPPQRPNASGSSNTRPPSSSMVNRGPPTMVPTQEPGPSVTPIIRPQLVTMPDLSQVQHGQQFQEYGILPANLGNPGNLQYVSNLEMQQFVMANQQGGVMMIPVAMNTVSGSNVVQLTDQHASLPQTDGENAIPDIEEADVELDLESGTLTIDTSKNKAKAKKTKKPRNAADLTASLSNLTTVDNKKPSTKKLKKEHIRKLSLLIPQADGGGDISDSSSEEEDEQLNRFVNGIDENAVQEEEDDVGDEDPLNSDDDQSDDEDLDTLFESNNIIVCQFEKVNRARNKWKFTLKDGIMHLEGKDYCFQKCTGEAEW